MSEATKNDHLTGGSFNAEAYIVTVTNAITIYNGIELLLLILVTFRRYTGLYFWALFFSSWGVLVYSLGYVINYYELTSAATGLAINNVGWWLMVSGQSFVLYSRLHLVLHDRKILKAVLAMIVVDAIIFHVPTTVLNFVANFGPAGENRAAERGYQVYEKFQMTGFCLQEFIISGLYLFQTIKLLNVVKADFTEARRTIFQLAVINVIIVIMDIALLGIEYDNQTVYEQVFKGVFYSVKLKLEFAILGKLVQIVDKNRNTMNRVLGGPDPEQDKTAHANGVAETRHPDPDFVDRSKSTDDPRYAFAKPTSRSPATVKSREWGDRGQRGSVTGPISIEEAGMRKNSARGRTQHIEKLGNGGNMTEKLGDRDMVTEVDAPGKEWERKKHGKLAAIFGRTWEKSHPPAADVTTTTTTHAAAATASPGTSPHPPPHDSTHQPRSPRSPRRPRARGGRRLTLAEALRMDTEAEREGAGEEHSSSSKEGEESTLGSSDVGEADDDDDDGEEEEEEVEEVDLYADAVREMTRKV